MPALPPLAPITKPFGLAALLVLAACSPRADTGPVVVSAIGGAPALADPARDALDTPARVMLDATAQGLVRFDATGQVEPGIAERWSVIDNGTSYIFRLRESEWADGQPVTASEVVKLLRRQLAPQSRNSLRPFLTAIDEIVEMTPEVIEIRLKRPRPDLLKLFAQPELALFRVQPPSGSGPFRVIAQRRRSVTLRPAFDPSRALDDEVAEPSPASTVKLIGERAARAIVRFERGEAALVTGGSFDDWPLVMTTQIAPANRRFDPAAGVFGLAVVSRDGVLADPGNRAAIARTIDRAGFVAAISADWPADTQLLPEQLDSAAPPAVPAWSQPPAEGEPTSRARIDQWRAANPGDLRLRIAVPSGPGGTVLFGYVGAALLSLGIQPERVALDAAADLRLIDAVAPYDSGRWYVATACQPCSEAATNAIEAAREADSPRLRAQQIAAADAALASDVAFIPLARPLRWSLVSVGLKAWTGNSRAWHPLSHLRNDSN
ncbi:ABC transporter substrate-binding protein [Sphingomonas glacialis]|uniref:ABC transporter substrate-binding protein n=1 Tax=Sphingomonas glacialis TaxID=658225 RepID=A0A502G0X1_9SPHN|nr:ABC transporter substrate-binding protein [Sphingomonas glacialis]TPG55271.1 ABC transporter substrate-binding protein [Sphingomonas glacialis]